jgi:hypothetical protein
MKFSELKHSSVCEIYYDTASQLQRYIYEKSEKAFQKGDSDRDSIESLAQLDARKHFIRESLIKALGGLPDSSPDLNARTVDILEFDGFKIEKVIFEPRYRVYVTANLYIPTGITVPCGAVLFLCGHFDEAKHHPEYQAICRKLVEAGLIVFAIDPVGQGERFSYFENSLDSVTIGCGVDEHDHAGFQCLLLGDSIARYFLHDAMRAVDYMVSRPEIDESRIGVTGNSGGGVQTSLMMICDTRVTAAAPGTFIMDRRSYMYAGGAQDCEQIWPGMSALGFDHEDILLCMAPKPVLVLASRYDFFPIEGTRRSVQRASRFWKMAGSDGLPELFEEDTGHAYTPCMADKAARFFAWHLLNKRIPIMEEAKPSLNCQESVSTMEPRMLWCTESGQIRGDFNDSAAVYEENLKRLCGIEQELDERSREKRLQAARAWLGERIFYHRRSCSLNPRFYNKAQVGNLSVQMCFWWSQEGLFNHAFVFRDFKYGEGKMPVTIAVWDGGTDDIEFHSDWIGKECEAGRAVLVLDVTGVGSLKPNKLHGSRDPFEFYGVNHKMGDDLIWLGDSIAAMRVWDVMRTVDLLALWKGLAEDDIEGYAYGRYGIYLQFAAFIDGRIKKVKTEDSIGSFRKLVMSRHYDSRDIMSIMIPGILKHIDLPDIDQIL